ncbi:uncharacterized protein MAM_06515 [Metarhizium album ARSEF 1941]|uniref:Uncharacterized protein n=1 Tax=Metarhizium album (strain ARSEF 1941) TaxID=1081103 RepID=A0A0B2WPW7_METAS|nr:uncharacterized protein MAM_06515 [Metarhizium album ARSEF 1941]KHN95674.1 hypothetical protein MAM_06515 [Metarhizium album ARSEF 1941]
MVKTYIPLPNWSTAPPPDGPLHLGHVLKSLKPGDFTAPMNRKTRVDIDAEDLQPVDAKSGFRMARKELLGGNFGIWAQLASVFGVGVEGALTYERGADDVLTVEKLETMTFIPTAAYVQQTLASPPVQLYLSMRERARSVYLITGLKVARGVSLESQRSSTKGARLKLAFAHPGLPVDGGPEVGAVRTREQGLSFGASSDFIIAARVDKITVDKKSGGEAKSELYFRGATMEGVGEMREEERPAYRVQDVSQDELAELSAAFHSRTPLRRRDDGNDGQETWMVPAGLED